MVLKVLFTEVMDYARWLGGIMGYKCYGPRSGPWYARDHFRNVRFYNCWIEDSMVYLLKKKIKFFLAMLQYYTVVWKKPFYPSLRNAVVLRNRSLVSLFKLSSGKNLIAEKNQENSHYLHQSNQLLPICLDLHHI